MKVNRNFICYILFLPSKNKKEQTSSASNYKGFISFHNFCWIFFQTCISHHGCEDFQIYGKLQFLENVLATQHTDSRYFYSYAATTPPPPRSPYPPCSLNSSPGSFITPQVTMTWNIRLFIFMWFVTFSSLMTLQFCKQNIYHIAW